MEMLEFNADGFEVRVGVPGDAVELARFGAETFRAAFGWGNLVENLEHYLRSTYSESLQANELRDPTRVNLILNSPSGEMAGYAQLRPGVTPSEVFAKRPIELQRFYIDARWHGRGLALQLMNAVVDAARSRGSDTVWLAVWERNPRAIAFYTKCGFVDVGSQPFKIGEDLQTDRVMQRSL
jgi:ribosomal protein S18 acetylase RimI-like enzyme